MITRYILCCCVALWGVLLVSCATPRKLYDPLKLSADQAATLSDDSTVTIVSIDNQYHGQDLSYVKLLPGEHTLKVDFFERTDRVIERDDMLFRIDYESVRPIEISFEAQAGKSYEVAGEVVSSQECEIEVNETKFLAHTTVVSVRGEIQRVYEEYEPDGYYYDPWYRSRYGWRYGVGFGYPWYYPHHGLYFDYYLYDD